jgi:hypothetical protein
VNSEKRGLKNLLLGRLRNWKERLVNNEILILVRLKSKLTNPLIITGSRMLFIGGYFGFVWGC